MTDAKHIERVAFRAHLAAFYAQRPEPGCHVLAKAWMTQAFEHGGEIEDFEVRVRAVQLLITLDTFVADSIRRRCAHA